MISATPKQSYLSLLAAMTVVVFFYFTLSSLVHAQAPPPPPPPPAFGGSSSSGSSSGGSSSGEAPAPAPSSNGGASAQSTGSTSGGGATQCPVILAPGTQYGATGEFFSYTMSVSGGTPDQYFFVGLPDGLSQNGDTISGTPLFPGTYRIGLTVKNSCGIDSAFFDFTVTQVAAGNVNLGTTGNSGGAVALSALPETGVGIERGMATVLLYLFIITMVSGAALVAFWPQLATEKNRSVRRRKRL